LEEKPLPSRQAEKNQNDPFSGLAGIKEKSLLPKKKTAPPRRRPIEKKREGGEKGGLSVGKKTAAPLLSKGASFAFDGKKNSLGTKQENLPQFFKHHLSSLSLSQGSERGGKKVSFPSP